MPEKTLNQKLKQFNRQKIFHCLMQEGPCTKQELVSRLGPVSYTHLCADPFFRYCGANRAAEKLRQKEFLPSAARFFCREISVVSEDKSRSFY